MLDPKFVLKNKEIVEKNCHQRGISIDLDLVEKLSKQRSQILRKIEEIRSKINKITKQIKQKGLKKEGVDLVKEGRAFKKKLKENEEAFRKIEITLNKELYKIPNLTHPDAPIGLTDQNNVEIKKIGTIEDFNFQPKNHLELGKSLDIFDFEGGVRTTGNKFYFLKNDGVLLELALIQYVFEILIKEGFQPFITPDLAKLNIIKGIGYNPRGPETQIYKITGSNLGLIATAEITLGGLFQNKTVKDDELPIKLAGLSHCFRREAGAYGKTSKGLYRVHQFTKVEMFVFSLPEKSDEMLNYLLDMQIKIFKGIEIPFRTVDCCTGDLGGSAYRKFDLETWMPAQNKWGEITSVSNCTDYQARCLNIKFKRKNEKKNELIHTLNGTGMAISRVLIALLENFQEADGSVKIPSVLQKWVGKEKIVPKKQ